MLWARTFRLRLPTEEVWMNYDLNLSLCLAHRMEIGPNPHPEPQANGQSIEELSVKAIG